MRKKYILHHIIGVYLGGLNSRANHRQFNSLREVIRLRHIIRLYRIGYGTWYIFKRGSIHTLNLLDISKIE